MLSDCFSESLGIVCRAVSLDPQGADIHPRIHGRQIWDIRLGWFWHGADWRGLIDILNRGSGTHLLKVKPVRKSLHLVYFSRSRNLFSAFAVRSKNRDVSADDVFHVDFGARIVLIANDHSGATNVFQAPIFQPEFVGVLRIDGNCRGDILELRADQGQTGFVLSDRRFALAVKRGIDHGKLPSRGRLAGPDAVLAAVKMDVFGDVAAIVNARKSRADVKIHMREEAMLGIVGAYAYSTRISDLNFDVDIADRRIERAGVRIRWIDIRARSAAREEHHVGGPLLKARRVSGKHKCGPQSAKTDQPDSRPDIDRLGQTVAAGRNEQNALVRRLPNLVDRLLQDSRIIRDSVPLHEEIIRRQINCFPIVGPGRVV